MILRARTLFLGWLVYGALQLALLGVPGASVQPGVRDRGARSQSESQSVSLGKRLSAPDPSDRRTPTTPFAASRHIGLDLPVVAGGTAVVVAQHHVGSDASLALPPARAPPALA